MNQTRYFTRKASRAYYKLSQLAYLYEKISWAHFIDRMIVLQELTRAKDPVRVNATRILEMDDTQSELFWDDENQENYNKIDGDIFIDKKSDKDEEPLFFYLVSISGLSKWHFHQYDDDFFPSIPHGHWENKKQPKLDSYLGWVYGGSKQIRRESRSLISKLWNDDKFRFFATVAIDYYMTKYPTYSGWRVPNSRRLPKKRKCG